MTVANMGAFDLDKLETRCLLSVVYDGPIVILHGGTYSGNWQSLDPHRPAVTIETSEPVVIQDSRIRSCGALVSSVGYSADVTIQNTRGYGLNPGVAGLSPGRFADIEGFSSVRIVNNYLEGTSGIYLQDYGGDHTSAETIKVLRNVAKNIDGRHSDGHGGCRTGPDDNDYVQFVQLNGVTSVRGAEIAWNQVINAPFKSRVEDNISVYDSSGRSTSPLLIHDNYIQGAYPADPVHDSTYTGGGIMLSDHGSSWVRAYNNQVVATTNYGIAISSGHNNKFSNNRIIASGVLPDGRRIAARNVGAYIWNSVKARGFGHNAGSANVIGWQGPDGRNDWWAPNASAWLRNTHVAASVTRSLEIAEYARWKAKLATAQITLGPLA